MQVRPASLSAPVILRGLLIVVATDPSQLIPQFMLSRPAGVVKILVRKLYRPHPSDSLPNQPRLPRADARRAPLHGSSQRRDVQEHQHHRLNGAYEYVYGIGPWDWPYRVETEVAQYRARDHRYIGYFL